MDNTNQTLTKDARNTLYLLFKEYERRRMSGQSRRDASDFGSAQRIRDLLLTDEPVEDVAVFLWELKRAGYVNTLDANNTVEECVLTPSGIVKMEQLPWDRIKSVADFIGNFIP